MKTTKAAGRPAAPALTRRSVRRHLTEIEDALDHAADLVFEAVPWGVGDERGGALMPEQADELEWLLDQARCLLHPPRSA